MFQAVKELTGPHSDTVHWRSQGGPVQFLTFGGWVMGSQGLVSSEQRTSRVTWALRPHLAGHWFKEDVFYNYHQPRELNSENLILIYKNRLKYKNTK